VSGSASDLEAFLARAHGRIGVDLGCGDARATARWAAAEPETLVVGIDANLDAADRVARRARRPREKGGLPNLLLLRAPAEALPVELDGRVDELRVELPWGTLLGGLVGKPPGSGDVSVALGRLVAIHGIVRITLNARALPEGISRDEAECRVRETLAAAGLQEIDVRSTAIRPETGWGKRLASGRPLEVIVATARRP